MKHFKLILTSMRIIVGVLFVANVIFMMQLYNSIKTRYLNDVEQCLSRADQIEMVDRIIDAGLGGDDDVVWVAIGLQKSDVGSTMNAEELRELDYSQGFRRVDKQIMSMIAQYLHGGSYADRIGEPDVSKMEEAFRRDLNFSGYYPEEVYIVVPGGTLEYSSDLWEIEYRVNGELTYYAYISPLTNNILRGMGGVITTSALIALVLTFGFWYLLHVIARQRTIEEMKDDFVNNMTHELKTPIAIAYAANDSLLQFPDPKDEERTKKYLTAALDQLSKLSGLVENILAMSMERRKHLTMAKEKIRLRDFLANIIEQQKLKADKPCDIILECQGDATVEADPSHFSNVIGNLIDNSIKYSDDSVSIVIKADAAGVSVSDNGIGIPEKSMPDIWSKFYRVPHGNISDVKGYGIGLFYVKSIIDKHGWSIGVESKLGKGSKFTIKFSNQ
ncbi:HAMP domain-containing sensor histidine kinase [uncultured Duncaniella sp.]|uniref:sensor histidine kinase n=1 Tax=uncultured Duncaniella sp. TaxID=2768039 RepID=UPI0025B5EBB9|nr:HAMP domain-containing sensor histidine kinase [uncultured Duncaniella sp.]